jgi:hypothetical protein
MRTRTLAVCLFTIMACDQQRSTAPTGDAALGPAPALVKVPRERMCVTLGSIDPHPSGSWMVSASKMRAVLFDQGPPTAELHFTYLGPTAETSVLGSGAVRRQIGLKLRAQNGCNLVYVMWRLEPVNELVVSIKSNPGQRTFAECQNRGYTNVKPQAAQRVPPVAQGSTHVLRADLRGDALVVYADGAVAWQGSLGPAALAFDGPVGIRTDNVAAVFDLAAGAPTVMGACAAGGDYGSD